MKLIKRNKPQVNDIINNIISARQLLDFEVVEVLWVVLVKFSNLFPGKSEHKRMINLINSISLESIKNIVLSQPVSDFLQIDPHLETVLSNPHEPLNPEKVKNSIKNFDEFHDSNPRKALIN